ncbi:MAG: hypothetical protein WA814_09555 [Candidatus Baltobacteraceae bacterium]
MNARHRGIVIGFDYYARYLARLLNEYSERWRLQAYPSSRLGTVQALWSLRKADALISFGGPGPSLALAEVARARRIPVIVIWAGSDVLTAAENPFDLAVIKRRGFTNLADGAWLVDELRNLGIDAAYRPVTSVAVSPAVAPFPRRFRVLTYLPEPRRAFYGESRVYDVARAMPDVEFVAIGAGKPNPEAPPNVTFCGYVDDVPARIDAATVLLRLPDHDGKSMLVLETLARARHVVWTHGFPGVHRVCGVDDALAALHGLYRAHRVGSLELNHAGRVHVRDEFSPPEIARRFESELERVTAPRPQRRERLVKRAAISGLGLFSAEVAKEIERLHPEWEVAVLSTASRLEVIAALLTLMRSRIWYSIGSPVTDRWVYLCSRALRKPHVIHWVGSDIEYLKRSSLLQKLLRARAITHLTEVSWTADELRGLGLPSRIVPLPLRHRAGTVKPLPQRFTVMLYLPKARTEFYGKSDYESLLREFAGDSLRVVIVGGGSLDVPAGVEVVNLGWRDNLRDVYEQATVLIRLTRGDGLSLMVLEALSFGRYVMWSKPFAHALHVRHRQDVCAGLRALLTRHRRGELLARYAVAEAIAREYAPERAVDQILRSWEEAR